MADVVDFLTRTRGRGRRWDWTDWMTYGYLALGVVLMFGPAIWLFLSSFKTEAELQRFPPRIVPYATELVEVQGYDEALPLYAVVEGEFEGRNLALIRRIGLAALMVDPADPGERLRLEMSQIRPVERVSLAVENYTELFERFDFPRYLMNSTVVTVVSTAIMILVNAMAAFALSKYSFRGNRTVLVLIIGTMMIPYTVLLVPLFLVTQQLGMLNSLWGVIIPGAATPTGVFLLRQYMLTIPDEIIEAARMDKASEWMIFWRIVVPLSAPAIAVLAILAIMWRWNDFLWPLIVLSESEKFTLQLALNSFQGENSTQWSNLLAMTVLTLAPIVCAFMFLQKFITTGIASTGGK